MLKAGTLDAAILIFSPVWGFLPSLASRSRTENYAEARDPDVLATLQRLGRHPLEGPEAVPEFLICCTSSWGRYCPRPW